MKFLFISRESFKDYIQKIISCSKDIDFLALRIFVLYQIK